MNNNKQSKTEKVEKTEPQDESDQKKEELFPIVGVGASAGGLDALKKFFGQLGPDSNMAFIVVIHMHPEQPSLMPELLQRVTSVPVGFAHDGETIEPNHIYVIPPNKELNVYKGTIQLLDLLKKEVVLPIDYFLRSLARDRGSYAVAVILSGTGTDGTLGIREMKNYEGLVLVQSPESAQYNGMPKSALDTGIVDVELPPEKMVARLQDFFDQRYAVPTQKEKPEGEKTDHWLTKLHAILVTKIRHDFSEYKKSTILRRIHRRMGVNQIDEPEHYIRFLRENSREAEALFRELLIGVTQFFREQEAFEILQSEVLPQAIGKMDENADYRVWVPGCSTGEEAYSLAIIIQEYLDEHPKRLNLQIFGTDIDGRAIDKARQGIYPSSIAADVSKERLNRFFTTEGEYYRIRKDIRDMIVFSVQDVIKDPPFSRINMLCCRNLLIYLNSSVQKKILSLFHYTLKPEGILMLGTSETVGQFTNLFKPLHSKTKIYKRKEVPLALRGPLEFPTGLTQEAPSPEKHKEAGTRKKSDLPELTKEVMLDLCSPTAVLVDNKGFILHVHGRTGKYLETVSGPPSHNILDMAREGLRIELSSALRNAVTGGKKVTRKNLHVKTNGEVQVVNLTVYPLSKPAELRGHFLVVLQDIEEKAAQPVSTEQDDEGPHGSRIQELEQELQNTRESHQTTIEELESSNEELKSTNEELQSSNEELQSTNEELESSKEELQSLNEELQTVNSELQSKVEELSAAHDDMNNLLNSTEVATIFVDNDIRIKRFTQEATTIINLIPTDMGRPLKDMVNNLDYEHLINDVESVLESLAPVEKIVCSKAKVWYRMRIMPYRTTDNRIEGAVITFLNIDDQKKAQEELKRINKEKEQDRLLIRKVFDMNPDPLAVLDENGAIVIANGAFAHLIQLGPRKIEGQYIVNLEHAALSRTDLKEKLHQALEKGIDFVTTSFSIGKGQDAQQYAIRGEVVRYEETEVTDKPYRILLHFKKDAQEEM